MREMRRIRAGIRGMGLECECGELAWECGESGWKYKNVGNQGGNAGNQGGNLSIAVTITWNSNDILAQCLSVFIIIFKQVNTGWED